MKLIPGALLSVLVCIFCRQTSAIRSRAKGSAATPELLELSRKATGSTKYELTSEGPADDHEGTPAKKALLANPSPDPLPPISGDVLEVQSDQTLGEERAQIGTSLLEKEGGQAQQGGQAQAKGAEEEGNETTLQKVDKGKKNIRAGQSGVVNQAGGVLGMMDPTGCTSIGLYLMFLFEGEDDYPFFPICNGVPIEVCFPGSSIVETPEGTRQMKDIQEGDLVATLNERGEREFVSVDFWMHREEDSATDYLQIFHSHDLTKPLSISPLHMVHVRKQNSETERQWGFVARPAAHVRQDDEILVEHDGISSPARVTRISIVPRGTSPSSGKPDECPSSSQGNRRVFGVSSEGSTEQCDAILVGSYAPVTSSGTLIVDGVKVSAYPAPAAWPSRHWTFPEWLAHLAMAPVRWWKRGSGPDGQMVLPPTGVTGGKSANNSGSTKSFADLVLSGLTVMGYKPLQEGGKVNRFIHPWVESLRHVLLFAASSFLGPAQIH